MTLPFAQSSFPEVYEQALVGPLFRPWVEHLLEEVELAAGDRVLDVACGTGIVARLAKERLGETGQVVGVDLSPAMLAVARRVSPAVDWREGFGEARPLEALCWEAGFRDVQSKTVSRTVRFNDGSVFVRLNAMALVGMSAASKEMRDEERERIVAAITRDSTEVVRPYTDATGLAFELSTNVATARV